MTSSLERISPSEATTRTLSTLADRVREACARDPSLDATAEPAVLGVYLGNLFVRDVAQGGFAQFFYNMQGNYLLETEQLLAHAGAAAAHDYYRSAVERCLAEEETYQAFLDGDYRRENTVKHALHLLSVDYFRGGGDPAAELADFVRRAQPQVEVWLEMASAARPEPAGAVGPNDS
ncbi:MAG: DUF4375 domain-containing protein [Holophagales bacterium]|nr:DUF4375 domain-containing protein [Holophagales bacterium]